MRRFVKGTLLVLSLLCASVHAAAPYIVRDGSATDCTGNDNCSSGQSATPAATRTCVSPSYEMVGDLMIAYASAMDDAGVATKAISVSANGTGWTEIHQTYTTTFGSEDMRFHVAYTTSDGSTPNYTLAYGNGTSDTAIWRCTVILVRDVYGPAPWDVTWNSAQFTTEVDAGGGVGVAWTGPGPASITTVNPDALVIIAKMHNGATGSSGLAPSGYTLIAALQSTSRSLVLASKEVRTPGVEDPSAWLSVGQPVSVDAGDYTLSVRAGHIRELRRRGGTL